jgi:protein-tyrosine phosphatase
MLVDFHAHILPLADHGCDSPEMARGQLNYAKKAGVEAIVSTPHFYPHRHTIEQFLARQERGKRLLSGIFQEGDPVVLYGAEVLVCPGMERMGELEKLAIQGSDGVILLELPFYGVNDDIWETICCIEERSFQPVIAHLDRYELPVINQALKMKIKIQLNAQAFQPVLKRRKWINLCKEHNVCAIGSDIHGLDKNGFQQLKTAVHLLGPQGNAVMDYSKWLLKLNVFE